MNISSAEWYIWQINFYSREEKILKIGMDDDEVKTEGGRLEIFEIADDEQLIGAELY